MENQTELESIREDLMSSVVVNAEEIVSDLTEDEVVETEIGENVELDVDESESEDDDDDQDPRKILSSYKKSGPSDGGSAGAYRGRFAGFMKGYGRENDLGMKPTMANVALYSGAGRSQMGPAEFYASKNIPAFREASVKSTGVGMSAASYSSSPKSQSSIGESAKMATDYSAAKSKSFLSQSLSKSGGSGGYCCACAAESISKLKG